MSSLAYLTLVHVLISLAAICAGFGVLAGLLSSRVYPRWTSVFLVSTIATSITGFFFPFTGFTPALAFGILSLILLAVACYSFYVRHLQGSWRTAYAITALLSLYLNFFVLIVQMFTKIPAIATLAPTQSELPFLVTHMLVLACFVILGYSAVTTFHPVLAARPPYARGKAPLET